MDIGTKAKMLRLATDRLEAVGLSFDFVTDQTEAMPRLGALEKQESVYPLDEASHTFTHTQMVWIFFVDATGKDVGVGAAKFEQLGVEDVLEYWARTAQRLYPDETYSTRPSGLSGDLIHLGNLFMNREWREPDGHIRASIFCLYLLASLQWPKAHALYGFIKERNMMKGSTVEYCFSDQKLVSNIWPDSRVEPLWMVSLPIEELSALSKTFLEMPDTFDSYKAAFRPREQKQELQGRPPIYPVEVPSRRYP